MPPRSPSFYEGASLGVLDTLSEGMHSMAQPLTVLRATLEVASGNASCISHYQRAIDSSLIEVSRLVETMGSVQELVRIARGHKDARTGLHWHRGFAGGGRPEVASSTTPRRR